MYLRSLTATNFSESIAALQISNEFSSTSWSQSNLFYVSDGSIFEITQRDINLQQHVLSRRVISSGNIGTISADVTRKWLYFYDRSQKVRFLF